MQAELNGTSGACPGKALFEQTFRPPHVGWCPIAWHPHLLASAHDEQGHHAHNRDVRPPRLHSPVLIVRTIAEAEATLPPGRATQRHHHRAGEEIYSIAAGAGELRLLCCCAPAYTHDDTFFD